LAGWAGINNQYIVKARRDEKWACPTTSCWELWHILRRFLITNEIISITVPSTPATAKILEKLEFFPKLEDGAGIAAREEPLQNDYSAASFVSDS
jgi:hypothetical protein